MAGLISAVVAALLAGIAASTYFAVRAAKSATEADQRAEDAMSEKTKAMNEKAIATKETERAEATTYDARLEEVQALRLARPPGWSKTCFESLRKNARMQVPGRDEEPLRTAGIACMLDLDVEEVGATQGARQFHLVAGFQQRWLALGERRAEGPNLDLGRSPAAVGKRNRRHGWRKRPDLIPSGFREPPSASSPWETAWLTGRCGNRSSGFR